MKNFQKSAINAYIGLMSGTSLDGLDMAYCHFNKNDNWEYEIVHTRSIPYPDSWRKALSRAHQHTANKLQQLSCEYGSWLGQQVKAWLNDLQLDEKVGIGSHGHTVFHQPKKGFSLQIGHGAYIAAASDLPVVCDFRSSDIALGGQGAPLVPIGDKLLFDKYDQCLNLGGFSNISFEKNHVRIAYDICPVNILLNHFAEKLGAPMDRNGCYGATGTLNEKLLARLNALEFYTLQAPRSLGREWLESQVLPLFEGLPPRDALKTTYAHIACQMKQHLKGSVLVTGGGAHNSYLINAIREVTDARLIIPEPRVVDFKEAVIFAFLAFLKLQNQINCLSSVTGAKRNHSAGAVFLPF